MPFKAHRKAIVKDVDSKDGIVTAYWSAFGNEDADGDIIEKGAYAKTIQERGPGAEIPRIKTVWQHDWWTPIGIPTELSEDDHGLLATFKISKTVQGRDALILYDDGVITEHSVRISEIKRREEDRRRITEVKLWEGSPVTWGANALTPVVDFKSAEDLAIVHKHMLGQVRRARKAVRLGISDELAESLELQLETWEDQLEAIDLAMKAQDLDTSTASDREIEAVSKQLKAAQEKLDALLKGRAGVATPPLTEPQSEEEALQMLIERL